MKSNPTISRKWAMPSPWTWSIGPIQDIVNTYANDGSGWADPFAGKSNFCQFRNDIDPIRNQPSSMDALDWLKTFQDNKFGGVLFDPPYSPRQISESYRSVGRAVNMETTQSSFWSRLKDEIQRTVRPGGYVITACWNSGGIGKLRGFKQIEILLVSHGGWHNDTIVTVEQKVVR